MDAREPLLTKNRDELPPRPQIERIPDSIRWSLLDTTRCGQRGYLRPCQSEDLNQTADSAFPMTPICATASEAVLIVDDEPDLRTHLTDLVASLGYHALACGSATELQEKAQRFQSGCILLDIKLPGLDGLAIQEWLTSASIKLPVIFISGTSDIGTVVQGMKAGAIDFLQKPISEMALRRAINRGIAQSRKYFCHSESAKMVKAAIAGLTPTELYVARIISKGYPTKLIAGEMGRSENTIKIHRSRIFNKLKINSAASLANLLNHADAI